MFTAPPWQFNSFEAISFSGHALPKFDQVSYRPMNMLSIERIELLKSFLEPARFISRSAWDVKVIMFEVEICQYVCVNTLSSAILGQVGEPTS